MSMLAVSNRKSEEATDVVYIEHNTLIHIALRSTHIGHTEHLPAGIQTLLSFDLSFET